MSKPDIETLSDKQREALGAVIEGEDAFVSPMTLRCLERKRFIHRVMQWHRMTDKYPSFTGFYELYPGIAKLWKSYKEDEE